LLAVLIAGAIQLALIFKSGSISNYFPNNVIEGMLAGIGVIILKQIRTHLVTIQILLGFVICTA
jgi:MFS superfamily sulfate permease-like transporter